MKVKASATRRRLSGVDRRAMIVEAASMVFAERGFDGATTQSIASKAGISEALLYRHFVSKQSIYRAVLRNLLRQQDEDILRSDHEINSLAAFLGALRHYLHFCLEASSEGGSSNGFRLFMASMIGDGAFARLILRRALRLRRAQLASVLENAREEGLLNDSSLSATNAFLFIYHVGAMMMLSRQGQKHIIPYEGDDARIVDDALLFCIRGLGFTAAALEREAPHANARDGAMSLRTL